MIREMFEFAAQKYDSYLKRAGEDPQPVVGQAVIQEQPPVQERPIQEQPIQTQQNKVDADQENQGGQSGNDKTDVRPSPMDIFKPQIVLAKDEPAQAATSPLPPPSVIEALKTVISEGVTEQKPDPQVILATQGTAQPAVEKPSEPQKIQIEIIHTHKTEPQPAPQPPEQKETTPPKPAVEPQPTSTPEPTKPKPPVILVGTPKWTDNKKTGKPVFKANYDVGLGK